MIEFDCEECGRNVIAVVEDKPRVPAICSVCTYVPKWYDDLNLVRIIDPERLLSTNTK